MTLYYTIRRLTQETRRTGTNNIYRYMYSSSRYCFCLPELDVISGITKAAESAKTEGIELNFGVEKTLKLLFVTIENRTQIARDTIWKDRGLKEEQKADHLLDLLARLTGRNFVLSVFVSRSCSFTELWLTHLEFSKPALAVWGPWRNVAYVGRLPRLFRRTRSST